jgi:hypothetical protein
MGVVTRDDGWRVPDELWAKIEPVLPPRPVHPLGCHNPRTPDRRAMDAILLVLRTGMQWRALEATGCVAPPPPTDASGSGWRPACFGRCGAKG